MTSVTLNTIPGRTFVVHLPLNGATVYSVDRIHMGYTESPVSPVEGLDFWHKGASIRFLDVLLGGVAFEVGEKVQVLYG